MIDGIACWFNFFRPIFLPTESIDCLCSKCFTTACAVKIDDYMPKILPEEAMISKAKDLPKTSNLLEGIDYYIENGNYVFKAWFHLKRGHCCANGRRHCPYEFKKI